MLVRARGAGPKAAVGVAGRHLVEARPQRGDLVALALGRRVPGGGQRVLNQRVLLHGRHTMPAAISMGATNSGGRVSTSSGGPVLLVGLDAAVACPRPRLGADHDDGVARARPPRRPARG